MNALITKPGFYPDITPEQYFAEPCPAPALTNSGIGTLLRSCPAKFAYEHPAIGQPPQERRDTAARYMGSLVHRLALDKGRDYQISPFDEYRSAEAKAWKLTCEADGFIPVKQRDFEAASAMAARIKEALVRFARGEEYQTEVVMAWQWRGRWCRAMLDVWFPSAKIAIDVKTTVSADDASIDRAFGGSYGRQEAWYRNGIERLTGNTGRAGFVFLFVEKEEPWLSREADASEALRTGSAQECDRAFEIFDACMSANEWPGYAPRTVQPTPWQVRDWIDAELEEAA